MMFGLSPFWPQIQQLNHQFLPQKLNRNWTPKTEQYRKSPTVSSDDDTIKTEVTESSIAPSSSSERSPSSELLKIESYEIYVFDPCHANGARSYVETRN